MGRTLLPFGRQRQLLISFPGQSTLQMLPESSKQGEPLKYKFLPRQGYPLELYFRIVLASVVYGHRGMFQYVLCKKRHSEVPGLCPVGTRPVA